MRWQLLLVHFWPVAAVDQRPQPARRTRGQLRGKNGEAVPDAAPTWKRQTSQIRRTAEFTWV